MCVRVVRTTTYYNNIPRCFNQTRVNCPDGPVAKLRMHPHVYLHAYFIIIYTNVLTLYKLCVCATYIKFMKEPEVKKILKTNSPLPTVFRDRAII